MTFNIHRSLTNNHGELDEDVAEEFEAELMQHFADSPEATPILERTGDLGWGGLVLEYGRIDEGVAVTTMGKRGFSKESKFVRVRGRRWLDRQVDDVPREDTAVCLEHRTG